MTGLLRRPLGPARVIAVSLGMAALLVLVCFASMLFGTAEISLEQVRALLFSSGDTGVGHARLILLDIRLPRIILAALVGFALALGGVVFQALLRNALADPFILGVSSGSAFGAIIGILLGFSFGIGVPAMSFAGALSTLFLLLSFGMKRIGSESSTILLTGVIINAFFTAMIMFFVSVSADAKLHSMLFWLYGDLSQTSYSYLYLIGPVLLISFVLLYSVSNRLNLLTAGEDSALRMGVDVAKTKLALLVVVSVMIGTVVAFSGLIGFVGLIVPHLARMAFGSDHRLLIPVAAFGGASFLVVADTLARTLIAPSELPVGVISAFVGAPFFLYLLLGKGSQWSRS
ncbi:MAG: iron ABC transporter permease [Chromatiaceae bacterium]|nr:iron ABC transporter permease [Chromatiaceae bacterium]